jgi:hypothetical protein
MAGVNSNKPRSQSHAPSALSQSQVLCESIRTTSVKQVFNFGTHIIYLYSGSCFVITLLHLKKFSTRHRLSECTPSSSSSSHKFTHTSQTARSAFKSSPITPLFLRFSHSRSLYSILNCYCFLCLFPSPPVLLPFI